MKFDYYELLTIKASLEFVQKKSKELDLSCLIKKVEVLINKEEKEFKFYGKDERNNED